ncbi:hypothetical protein Fmac_005755 [Flemingia macrophylla]|uniref:Uncharacterized protein n=1 Tax=Flemingia macrophylla TaxID=520843 RepID=A0ABD1N8S1_9FABA
MSFNCLTCGHFLQMVDSERESLPEMKASRRKGSIHDRSWSGDMNPSQRGGGVGAKNMAEHHRRTNSESDVGPRLVSVLRRSTSESCLMTLGCLLSTQFA